LRAPSEHDEQVGGLRARVSLAFARAFKNLSMARKASARQLQKNRSNNPTG